MKSLDQAVERDTIFLAEENVQLGGFFKKLRKKVKKVTSKIGRTVIPKKIYSKMKKFEKSNRKGLKKLGAVSAIAAGAYFAGPAIYKYGASKLGGKSLVASSIRKFGKSKIRKKGTDLLRKQAKKKLMAKFKTPQAAKQFTHQMRQLPPEQVLQHPFVTQLGRDVAAQEAYRINPPEKRQAAAVLAREGAYEVEHQTAKRDPSNKMMDYLKIGAPIVGVVVGSLLMKS